MGLKVAALVLSLALWLYVKSLEEPMTRIVFTNVPLVLAGENPDIRVVSVPGTITASVSVPTAQFAEIDQKKLETEIRAYVDVSDPRLGIADYPVQLVPPVNARKFEWRSDNRVTIETEQVARQSFEVQLVPSGNPPSGLEFANAAVDPGEVTVEAGQTTMNKVVTVRVLVNLETAQSGQSQDVKVEVLDASNRPINEELARVIPPVVKVTPALAPAQPKRNLVVSPIWQGQPAMGFRVVDARLEPAAITVFGPRDRLQGLSTIETEPISLEGLTADAVREVKLRVPRGVRAQGSETIRVRIRIGPAATVPAPETPSAP